MISFPNPESASLLHTHLIPSLCQRKHHTLNWTSWLCQAEIQNMDLYLLCNITVHESTKIKLKSCNYERPRRLSGWWHVTITSSFSRLVKFDFLVWSRLHWWGGIFCCFHFAGTVMPVLFDIWVTHCNFACAKGEGEAQQGASQHNWDRLVSRITTLWCLCLLG